MSADEDVFDELYRVVQARLAEQPEGSYTASLVDETSEGDAVLAKLGEETTELVVAAKNDDADRIVAESADLLYHLLVLLAVHDVELDAVRGALRDRRN